MPLAIPFKDVPLSLCSVIEETKKGTTRAQLEERRPVRQTSGSSRTVECKPGVAPGQEAL